MVQRTGLMTIDDFIRLYDTEGPFELVDGERITVSPTVARHTVTLRVIFRALDSYCQSHHLGEVFQESPFVLTEDSQWVLGSKVPDVMYYEASRWTRYTENTDGWQDRPFMLVPDLAVEVVSPTDRYTDIQKKVDSYLSDGVRLIWIIDPGRKGVTLYQGASYQALAEADTLTGGDVLPGFSLPLPDLFG